MEASTRSSAWDWRVKVAQENDRLGDDAWTQSQTATDCSGPSPDDRGRWLERHFVVATQLLAVEDAVASATRRREVPDAVLALRRALGGFVAVRDSLYAIVDAEPIEPASAPARFLECAYWWMGQLLSALAQALEGEAKGPPVADAARFSALYALSYVTPLRDACAGGGATLCANLQADITWLAEQLTVVGDES
jgi:hypothetical protein